MATNYKTEAIKELAADIKRAGFRVFIAENGQYGFFTDAEGTRVVSFQYDLPGFKFSGNYKSVQAKQCGTGWVMGEYGSLSAGQLSNLFNSNPPRWATGGFECRLTTLAQHLATYQASSRYVEFEDKADN